MSTMHRYYLGFEELDDAIGGVKGGTNMMLTGPPMCGKDSILNTIICSLTSGEAVICLSTKTPGENIIEESSSTNNNGSLGIINCISRSPGVNASDAMNVKRASGPVDLTGIVVRISQFLDGFRVHEGNARLCVNSLSTILMYSSLATVFRFMHVFSGRVTASKATGVYIVEDGMHDAQTIYTLKPLFNAVIEVKVDSDGYLLRVAGLTPKPTGWYEYEVIDNKAVIRGVRND